MSIKILSRYDEDIGKYIDEIPDFEEEPTFTPSGKPLVSAVQDRCPFAETEGMPDCGSCKFYRTNSPGDLIGVCINENNLKQRKKESI